MAIVLLTLTIISSLAFGQSQTAAVVVNGIDISPQTIQALQSYYQVQIQPGRYWYDKTCGAWGYEGGPGVGVLWAGLELGGSLQEDASNGTTGVFINGRRLHTQDVDFLENLMAQQILPGRYWLNAQGFAGLEGGPALVNLYYTAQQRRQSGGGSSLNRNWLTGIGAGSDGNTSYVMGDGWSVIVGD